MIVKSCTHKFNFDLKKFVADVVVTFPCGLRSYHVYRTVWSPLLNERLNTIHESSNNYDRYAVAATKDVSGHSSPTIVGHLPKEISRITRYIMQYAATVTVRICDINYRRSPLIQGGLEIPVEVTVCMPFNPKNKAALDRFESLLAELYKEPANGKHEDITATILEELESDSGDEEL